MSLLYPIIGVIGEVFGKVSDKFNFKRNKIKPTQEIFLVFLIMVIGTICFMVITKTELPVFSVTLFFLIILIILISFFQNIFEFNAVKTKDLSFREPFVNLQPVITSFLAFIIFSSEREIKYLIAIVLGTIILYIGNFEKKQRFNLDKGTVYIILAILFSAILSNIYKFGLEIISPEILLFVRVAGVLILLILIKQITFEGLNKKKITTGTYAGIFYLIGNLASLYSIKYLGLNFTIMILLLGSALTYILSHIILKEKILLRRIITSILLLILVVVTTII